MDNISGINTLTSPDMENDHKGSTPSIKDTTEIKDDQIKNLVEYESKPQNLINKHGEERVLSSSEFFRTGFLANEKWDNTYSIPTRVIGLDNNLVNCECVVDRENLIIENRNFPRILFNHIENIKEGTLVLIKLMFRVGSQRINIYSGEKGLVDEGLFTFNDDLDELNDGDFDRPFTL